MKTKYNSYQEIDRELQILKIQREIHIQKMLRSSREVKQTLMPLNLIKTSFSSFRQTKSLFGNSGGIKTILISALIKFALNRFLKKNK